MHRDTFYFSLCDKPSLLTMSHAHGNDFSFTGSLPGFPRGNQDSQGVQVVDSRSHCPLPVSHVLL